MFLLDHRVRSGHHRLPRRRLGGADRPGPVAEADAVATPDRRRRRHLDLAHDADQGPRRRHRPGLHREDELRPGPADRLLAHPARRRRPNGPARTAGTCSRTSTRAPTSRSASPSRWTCRCRARPAGRCAGSCPRPWSAPATGSRPTCCVTSARGTSPARPRADNPVRFVTRTPAAEEALDDRSTRAGGSCRRPHPGGRHLGGEHGLPPVRPAARDLVPGARTARAHRRDVGPVPLPRHPLGLRHAHLLLRLPPVAQPPHPGRRRLDPGLPRRDRRRVRPARAHPVRPARHQRLVVQRAGAVDGDGGARGHRRPGDLHRRVRRRRDGLLRLRPRLPPHLPRRGDLRRDDGAPAALARGPRLRRQAGRDHRQRRHRGDAGALDGRRRRARDDAAALAVLHHVAAGHGLAHRG